MAACTRSSIVQVSEVLRLVGRLFYDGCVAPKLPVFESEKPLLVHKHELHTYPETIITVGHRTNIRTYTVVVQPFRCWCAKNVRRSKKRTVELSSEKDPGPSKKPPKRQVMKSTFKKRQREHDRQYSTLSWLRCVRFQIGDVIRTWWISQSSVAVSHENLDVECSSSFVLKAFQ